MPKPQIGRLFSHNKKPQHIYRVVDQAVNCTNAPGEQHMIVYKRANPGVDQELADLTFVREQGEFFRKFTPVTDGE